MAVRWGTSASARRAEQLPLVVNIVEDRWESVRHIALICGLNVEITNTSNRPIRLSRLGAQLGRNGVDKSWDEEPSAAEVTTVVHERWRRQQQQYYGPALNKQTEIPPNERVSGWIVLAANRNPHGGTPEIVLEVEDTTGHRCQALLPKKQAQADVLRDSADDAVPTGQPTDA